MRSVQTWAIRTAMILLAISFLAAIVLWIASEFVLNRTYNLRPGIVRAVSSSKVNEGRRLAKLYGCTSCHGADYRGSLYNEDPTLVRNHAPNLTLVAAQTTDAGLAQAIRQGVRASDGRALWGMPSATFSTITDAELGAVIAHLRSLPVGGKPMRSGTPGFRARLAIVRELFGQEERIQRPAPAQVAIARNRPPLNLGAEHQLGRHIAATVCSECHGSDLGGDAVEKGPDLMIAGAYDLEAFRRLMRTGAPPNGRDLGIMSETARADLKVFTDDEIAALHAYLVARANHAEGD